MGIQKLDLVSWNLQCAQESQKSESSGCRVEPQLRERDICRGSPRLMWPSSVAHSPQLLQHPPPIHPGSIVAERAALGREDALVALPGYPQPLPSVSSGTLSNLLLVFKDQYLCPGETTFSPTGFFQETLITLGSPHAIPEIPHIQARTEKNHIYTI